MLKKIVRRFSKDKFPVEEDRTTWGPVVITIGPQCCGKSTFIKSLNEPFNEFVLEDAVGIVETVPIHVAVNLWSRSFVEETDLPELSVSDIEIMGKKVYGVTLEERLNKMVNTEQMLLTLLFTQEISFEYFETQVEKVIVDLESRNLFLQVVSEIFKEGHMASSPTIDVLIPEALNDVKANLSELMETAMCNSKGLVCWGNTNMSPEFYKETLSLAAKYSRVVRFVRWGQELECVSLYELEKRNVHRFLQTGRYASVSKLSLFHKHSERTKVSQRGVLFTHMDLARFAGYDMDILGRVQLTAPVVPADKPKKPVRRLTHGGNSLNNLNVNAKNSLLFGKLVSTRWAKWSNDGHVFPLVPPSPTSPNSPGNGNVRIIPGPKGRPPMRRDNSNDKGNTNTSVSAADNSSVRDGTTTHSVYDDNGTIGDTHSIVHSEGEIFRGLDDDAPHKKVPFNGQKPKEPLTTNTPAEDPLLSPTILSPSTGGIANNNNNSTNNNSNNKNNSGVNNNNHYGTGSKKGTPTAPPISDPFACVFDCTGLSWFMPSGA